MRRGKRGGLTISEVKGTCWHCGRIHRRQTPEKVATCDCWKYCPFDHGKGEYRTLMDEYSPDLTPRMYSRIEGASGDSKHPIKILRVCPVCGYHSAQTAIEVKLG